MEGEEKAEVKVGDTIAFHDRYYSWSLATVTKITPSGRLSCTNGTVLNPNLTVRGRGEWDNFYKGEIPTEELLKKINKQHLVRKLVYKIKTYNWERLSEEKLTEVYNLITSAEGE